MSLRHSQPPQCPLSAASRFLLCSADLSEMLLNVFERSDGVDERPVRLAHVAGWQALGGHDEQYVIAVHLLGVGMQRMRVAALAAASWARGNNSTGTRPQ